MKYTTEATATAEPITDGANSCCLRRAEQEWATDDIVLAVANGLDIPTDAVDRLPPWRAIAYVEFAMKLPGARMEHGDLEQLKAVVKQVGVYAKPGWWREALGHDPQPPATTAAARRPEYVAPSGWSVVRQRNAGPL
jgi:hypothetical protein